MPVSATLAIMAFGIVVVIVVPGRALLRRTSQASPHERLMNWILVSAGALVVMVNAGMLVGDGWLQSALLLASVADCVLLAILFAILFGLALVRHRGPRDK